MNYSFLAEIINKNWFQEIDNTHERKWSFQNDFDNLSIKKQKDLLILIIECLGIEVNSNDIESIIKSLKQGESYNVEGITINKDFIIKVLISMTLSEYRIDSLLFHPTKMRHKEINELSLSVGLPVDILKKIYFNWHSFIRKKVFP